jgi:hypothetical protein
MDVGIKTTHEASVAACQEIAEWADENPDERRIAKYLYEKKGYPIDLNGNLPSFDETMKDAEKYLKYKQDKLIEKAYNWLKTNKNHPCLSGCLTNFFIEDFKNYMEGE